MRDKPTIVRRRLRERLVCSYCHDTVDRSLAASCDQLGCGARYHRDCWRECSKLYGGCAVYGCRPEVVVRRAVFWRRISRRTASGLALALVGASSLSFALGSFFGHRERLPDPVVSSLPPPPAERPREIPPAPLPVVARPIAPWPATLPVEVVIPEPRETMDSSRLPLDYYYGHDAALVPGGNFRLAIETESNAIAGAASSHDAARAHARRALAAMHLSLELGTRERVVDAITDLEQAIALEPSQPAYWFDRAIAHDKNREPDLMIADSERFLALAPAHPEADFVRSRIEAARKARRLEAVRKAQQEAENEAVTVALKEKAVRAAYEKELREALEASRVKLDYFEWVGKKIEARHHRDWRPATVLRVQGSSALVHMDADGYDAWLLGNCLRHVSEEPTRSLEK
ncbi:hypothetical protein HY251_05975 [bacterium]|nr:hypothetical protein [bacterium]